MNITNRLYSLNIISASEYICLSLILSELNLACKTKGENNWKKKPKSFFWINNSIFAAPTIGFCCSKFVKSLPKTSFSVVWIKLQSFFIELISNHALFLQDILHYRCKARQGALQSFPPKKGNYLFNWTVLSRRPKTVSVYSNSILFDSSFQKLRILNCLFRHCAKFVCLNCWKSSIFEWNSSNYDLNLNKSL